MFIDKWLLAKSKGDVIVLGDTNLDHLKWPLPDHDHIYMTDITKNEIETEGFSQIVEGYTRSWVGQANSLIDQCWSNCGNRIISCRNIVRGASDHNLIELVIRTKGVNSAPKEAMRRQRKNFILSDYVNRVKNIDWSNLYDTEDLDIANDIFENNIKEHPR